MKKLLLVVSFVSAYLFISMPAHAWDCTVPGQIRVQVPAGTIGNGQGDGNGQVDTVEGITFQCQNPPSPNTGSNTNTNQNNNSNQQSQGQNQGQSQSSNNNNKNTNSSSSNSSSSSSATGGNATGGQANASNNSNGNGSNNTDVSSTYVQPRQVASAIAPDALPSAPCIKGFSGAAQTGFFGASFGGGAVDKGCDDRETARLFALMGNRTAAAKILCQTPAAKRAHLTMEDCMAQVPEPVAIIPPAPAPVQTQEIQSTPQPTVAPAASVALTVVPATEPSFTPLLLGICTFGSNLSCDVKTKLANDPTHVTFICDQMIDQAIALVKSHPGTVVKIVGNENDSEREANTMYAVARVAKVKRQFIAAGLDPTLITTTTGMSGDRTVEIWVVNP